MENRGKVYIIGAGCGNIDLLTLKGKRCIEEADCIVYDRLIDKKILKLAKAGAELLYFGKGNSEGGEIQEDINNILIKKGLEGKIVARVKGGDPFVFGRGGEEIQGLVENNIPFEIIPGISSSIAVPEYAGIPVTHRGISRSFHVFTGHTMENGKWHNFEVIAKLEGTLVFLMGIKNLDIITKDLMKNGKNPETPVAIIEKGTTPNQRVTKGNLSNIVELAKDRNILPPAITIIGEVVNLSDEFSWMEKLSLYQKKIMITRDIEQGKSLSKKVLDRGGEAINLPFIEISPIENVKLDILQECKVLLFNSPNGVKYFMDSLEDIREISNIKIGVVGEKTREILESYKIKPDFMPEKYLGEELAKMGKEYCKKGEKIVFITSDISPAECEKWCKIYGRKYEKLVLYKTGKIKYEKKEVENRLKDIDYITFLSSSAVEAFNESIENDITLLKDIKIVSIGPVTTNTLKSYGYRNIIEAKKYTEEGIILALESDRDDK